MLEKKGTAFLHQKRTYTRKRHKAFVQEQGYKKIVPKLPYAYLTVKCHNKDPISSRFIVGVAADQRARNDGEELSVAEKLHFATTKSLECSTTNYSISVAR